MLVRRALRPILAIVVGLTLTTRGAQPQHPGRPLADDVAKAMGGGDKILAVKTLTLDGAGENFNLGQNASPYAPLRVYGITEYHRAFDFSGKRWRQEQTRTPRFITPNTAPQRQRIGFDGVAYDIAPDDKAARVAGRADIERADELIYHPVGFLQAALAQGTELTEEPPMNGLRSLRMSVGGEKYGMMVDPYSKLPVTIQRIVHHPMMGDALLETRLTDWREAGGIKLPMQITQRLDGRWMLSSIRLGAAHVNRDAGDLAAPADVRSAPPVVPAIIVNTQEIAPGVWYLTGQTHHSVVIEMRDHLLLVEAPQGDARTLAVIRKARELRPGKPLRAVINTHHHFDHAGGIRTAISEGLTIITQSKNFGFYRELAGKHFFIVPDALAESGKRPRFEMVNSKRVLTDGSRNVEIHQVRGSPEAATQLVVYLPAEKLLIEADSYNPPAATVAVPPRAVFAPALVANIDRLKLSVDRIVPLHGQIVPISELRAAAEASRAPVAATKP
ncbi:MAG: MBL fold metallo-hydrolase [Gemmatimonadota bacterium]|nr:MBL fold metallo-hydrolase [Gemmatimonadota bacterium]